MAIFQTLSDGPMAVNELARTLPVSRPAIRNTCGVLKDAGRLTTAERERAGSTRRIRKAWRACVRISNRSGRRR